MFGWKHLGEIEDCELSLCSASCGGGWKSCERSCKNGDWGLAGCPDSERVRNETCNTLHCPGEINSWFLTAMTFSDMWKGAKLTRCYLLYNS